MGLKGQTALGCVQAGLRKLSELYGLGGVQVGECESTFSARQGVLQAGCGMLPQQIGFPLP